jgi:DNA-binding beta-propeller fold protein YncE
MLDLIRRGALVGLTAGAALVVGWLPPVTASPRAQPAAVAYGAQQVLIRQAFHNPVALTALAVDAAGDVFSTTADSQVMELPAGSANAIALPFDGLSGPQGVAVDRAGDVFVSDTGHSLVLELPAGASSPLVLPFAGLSSPEGIAVDYAGDLFVADDSNSRVVELRHGASSQRVLPFTGLTDPESVAVHDGDIFVADTGNNRVLKLANGASVQTVVPMSVNQPHDVALDRTGDVFVAANQITELAHGADSPTLLPLGDASPVLAVDARGDVFAPHYGGIFEYPAGGPAAFDLPATRLTEPEGVAVDPQGDVFVADTSHETGRLLRLSVGATTPTTMLSSARPNPPLAIQPQGGSWRSIFFTGLVDNQLTQRDRGSTATAQLPALGVTPHAGLAADRAGDLFALDIDNFDSNNDKVVKLPAGASSPSTLPFPFLSLPRGIAVDAAGDVFVLDDNQVFELAAGASTSTTLPIDRLYLASAIAADQAGDVFVTDQMTGRVVELPRGATSASTLPFTGLSMPDGIAVDRNGDLFVTDQGTSKLLELPAFHAPKLIATDPPDAIAGSAYSYRFTASGYPAPTYAVASGTVPHGLHLGATTGLLSGTPTTGGMSIFTVEASNSQGTVESMPITIDTAASVVRP